MKQSYDHLIERIGQLEGEVQHLETENRRLKHQDEQRIKTVRQFERRMKTLQTLSLGMFSMLELSQIYALACENIVYQLAWDSAFIISLQGNRVVTHASYQATEKQLNAIHDYLAGNRTFVEAYTHRQTFSTFNSKEVGALALRTLFQTDELILMPILFAEHTFAYLIVCTHTNREMHSEVDVDFLAIVAGQIGQAAQNSRSFSNLEEQNAHLRKLDELKNSFISITSHQLRTPLSIVKWILSVLQSDEIIMKEEKQLHLIDQAYESNERLIRVVNNLLNVSRIQEGQLPYNPQMVDLPSLMQDLCKNAEKNAATHKLELKCDIGSKVPPMELDPLLFKEALQNLIDNALAYNRENGYISISLVKKEKELLINVSNTGFGISADDQTKIFDQFYRAPEAMNIQPNGNGLGLFLTRAIIRQHKGEVTCVSKPGEETTFTIHLPLPHL